MATVTYRDNQLLLDLRELMIGYLSPASVDSTLAASLDALALDPATVGPGELPGLVERAMLGLRMFCASEELPELMLDLAEFCERAGS